MQRVRLGRRRSVALVLAVACSAVLALAGCSARLIEDECGASGGCVAVVPVPTSSRAAHSGGGSPTVEGILEASVRSGRICLRLDRDGKASAANLVLPVGTRATPLGELPSSGPADLRLLGDNEFGGVRTGDRIAVTPDHRETAGRVRGCAVGPTIYSGSVVVLPTPTATEPPK